jgi:hypothetical protein
MLASQRLLLNGCVKKSPPDREATDIRINSGARSRQIGVNLAGPGDIEAGQPNIINEGERAAPGNWKCEEQRIVEVFAEKAAGPASLPALNRVPVATRDSPRGQAASVPAQQTGYFAVPPTMP